MIRFSKYIWLYIILSSLVILPGIYSLFRWGLRQSIDFTGGTLLEIQTKSPAQPAQIIELAKAQQIEIFSVQPSPDNIYLLRSKSITQEQSNLLKTELGKNYGEVVEKRFETVGPTIGAELTQKSFLAVIVASVFIIIYLAWSFKSVPAPYTSWKFGASAVLALLHDVIVVVGIFSLFGHFFKVEIDALFITALLTIIGFSVHDTIVVFDRVRENLPKMPKHTFEEVVDFSITETLNRSLNTSMTVVLTLTSLLLFGGETIRWFVVALLIGIVSGTYSSIFNASPILVLWENKHR